MATLQSPKRTLKNTPSDKQTVNNKLKWIKAILASAGIDDFTKLGKLTFSENRVIGPGITTREVINNQNSRTNSASGRVISITTGSRSSTYTVSNTTVVRNSAIIIPGSIGFTGPSTVRAINNFNNSVYINGLGPERSFLLENNSDLFPSDPSMNRVPPGIDREMLARGRTIGRVLSRLGREGTPGISRYLPSLENLSAWVAPEITLKRGITITLDSRVKRVLILAKKITIEPDVVITWQPDDRVDFRQSPPPDYANSANNGSNGERLSKHGKDGDDGLRGARGENGGDGADAPIFDIWTEDMNTLPTFILPGQDGANGQNGQNGQNGGKGGKGYQGEAEIDWDLSFCKRRPGNGGDGGTGGPGGLGGNGGHGGRPGELFLFSLQSILDQNQTVQFDNSPGIGGAKGVNGNGGKGGKGGGPGDRPKVLGKSICDRASRGKDGNPGQKYPESSVDGDNFAFPNNYSGPFFQLVIQRGDLERKLTEPIITTVSPDTPITVGDEMTIYGANFFSGDVVKIEGNNYTPDSVTATAIKLKVPDIQNGNKSIQVFRPTASITSNTSNFVVKLSILDIEQDGIKRSDFPSYSFKPGKKVKIYISGLSGTTSVMLDDVQQQGIRALGRTALEFDLVDPPNPIFDSVGYKGSKLIIRDSTTNQMDETGIKIDTFIMVAFGDSMVWGQGLSPNEKYTTKVLNTIINKLPGRTVHFRNFAHSGAIIGKPDITNERERTDGEVPNAHPSLYGQLEEFDNDPEFGLYPESVDLIIMDGGINDVKVKSIFGANSHIDEEIESFINEFCYENMRNLLVKVAEKFPNATIIVPGYHWIVSSYSNLNPVELVLALDFAYIHLIPLVPGLNILSPDPVTGIFVISSGEDLLKTFFQRRARLFFEKSTQKLDAAVSWANQQIAGPARIHFVYSNYNAKNAINASESLIWSMFPLNDSVVEERKGQCRVVYDSSNASDWLSLKWCESAAFGHPNRKGAEHYKKEIVSYLESISFFTTA